MNSHTLRSCDLVHQFHVLQESTRLGTPNVRIVALAHELEQRGAFKE
jgi:hypothetical protein